MEKNFYCEIEESGRVGYLFNDAAGNFFISASKDKCLSNKENAAAFGMDYDEYMYRTKIYCGTEFKYPEGNKQSFLPEVNAVKCLKDILRGGRAA